MVVPMDDSRKYWTLGVVSVVVIVFFYLAEYGMREVAQVVKPHMAAAAATATAGPVRSAPTVPPPPPAPEGSELLGTTPGEWTLSQWLNSQPISLTSLRGKVVLVRWWTAPQCEYCATTAPALNECWDKYRDQGLVVIGAYHHKTETPLTADHVAAWAEKYGFKFPVATDADWQTLRQWWINTAPIRGRGRQRPSRNFTSVTFLLDREGVIRHIHPGGAYAKGDAGYTALVQELEKLLAASAPPPAAR